MTVSKIFFEQIPIETVKRIAREFPEEDAIGSDDGNRETPAEVKSPRDSWREVAQKVQHERDPKRMIELVQQLIVMLDQEQLCRRLPSKQGAGNRAD